MKYLMYMAIVIVGLWYALHWGVQQVAEFNADLQSIHDTATKTLEQIDQDR